MMCLGALMPKRGEPHKGSPQSLSCKCREEHPHLMMRVVKSEKLVLKIVEPCGHERHPSTSPLAIIVLTDDDPPQLQEAWMEKTANLVSGIPLKLPPLWEVNHETNLIVL